MGVSDGLGFEEVNQSVTSTETISGNYVYATTSVNSALVNGTTISGTTIKGTTISGTNILNSQGLMYSIGVGSPVTYGAKILAGSIATAAGSGAFIPFGALFTNNQYKITFGNVAGSDVAFVSGTAHRSGCAIVGAPSQTYNYIAIGF